MFSERTNWKLTTNQFTRAVDEARARGARLLDLTVSNPTRAGLKYDERAILGALSSPLALDYDPQSQGLLAARDAVAEYYRAEHGVHEIDPECIVLTTSTSEGYSFVFRLLCNAGDELLVPKPSYPLFEFLADLQDVKLVGYPLIYDHGWQLDFPSLEQAVTERTRGVVLVHPNNPTGSYVSAGERELLNAFCHKRGLAVIVDEVFLDYGLKCRSNAGPESLVERQSYRGAGHTATCKSPGDEPQRSFAGNDDVLTFTLSGLSKISALPQMKVSWIVTSGPDVSVKSAMGRLDVIADTYLSMNAPVQWALPVLLEQRKSVQGQLMERVRLNLAELDRQLAQQTGCERLNVEGGWYTVLRIPVTQSDEELAIQLVREKSVLVHPGHFFDFPRDGYLVLSLISSVADFAAGVRAILDTMNS